MNELHVSFPLVMGLTLTVIKLQFTLQQIVLKGIK